MDEAQPYHEKAIQTSALAKEQEAAFVAKRKLKTAERGELRALEERWKGTLREAREAGAKAVAIENAAYDLKAVNPNSHTKEDTRTAAELIAVIEEKGREVDAALTALRDLVYEKRSA